MANEIIDTIKAAIKESNINADELYNSLKAIIGENVSFKDYILERKKEDIGRYEDNIPLENNVLIIQIVKENNIVYEVMPSAIENKTNLNEVKKSISTKNLYISNRESTGLYSYGGVLPRYYLDYVFVQLEFNPNITFQPIKEKLL